MVQTYYEILKVGKEASDREIKRAYHKLARDLHPDKASDDNERKKNEILFAEVSKAYNILKDKKKRAEYDQSIKKQKEGTGKQKESAPKRDTESKGSSIRNVRSKERNQIARKAYVKGMQIYKTGNYNKAYTFFKAAIENDDEESLYFYRLAKAMMKARKSFTKAVEYCNRAIEMDPYNMEYKLLLGEIYEAAGGKTKAKSVYEEILKWDKTNFKAKERLEMLGFSVGGRSKSFFTNLLKRISRK